MKEVYDSMLRFPISYAVKHAFICLALVLGAGLMLAFSGCARCGTCQGAEIDPESGDEAPSPPLVSKARPWPSRPARAGFATPPEPEDDDVAEPGDVETPRPTAKKARHTRTTEGISIQQSGDGAITINSSGVPTAPNPPALPAAGALPAFSGFATPPVAVGTPTALPIIPGPLTDAQYVGLFKRMSGAGYYFLTGKCPTFASLTARRAARAQAAAVVPAAYAPVPVAMQTVQTVSYAQVPVTSYATVPVASYAQMPVYAQPVAPLQAPAYAPAPPPAAAPLPPLPSAQAMPLASPQTPAVPGKGVGRFFR